MVWLVGKCGCHDRSFSGILGPRLFLSPDNTSLELLARGVSDLVKKHLSVEDRLQEQQDKWHHRMKDQEAMWSQRLREVEDTWYQRLRKETANWYQREEEKAEKLEARFFHRLQDARADWEQLNAQKNRAALESVDKIAKLKVWFSDSDAYHFPNWFIGCASPPKHCL